MEWKIVHLFPDLMNLYGEYANLALLRRHLEALGDSVSIERVAPEETPHFAGADLIYMGAGTERSQKAALHALLPHAAALRAAQTDGALLFFTGNAFALLGRSVTDAAGKSYEALGLAPYETVESTQRITTDVYGASALFDAPVVGFMNKCSRTTGVTTPFLTGLSLGFGNAQDGGSEGYLGKNLLATHLTGPVLVKNPQLTAYVLGQLYAARGAALPRDLPAYPHEAASYAVTERELRKRFEK